MSLSRLIKFFADYWLPISLLLMSIIAVLSLTPLPDLPDAPGGDKLHHLIAYASLAIPISLNISPKIKWVLLIYVLFGGVIELIQPFVNRYGEWSDFAANSFGVLLGYAIAHLIRTKLKLK